MANAKIQRKFKNAEIWVITRKDEGKALEREASHCSRVSISQCRAF